MNRDSLKAEINLLLKKLLAWDMTTHHDLPTQEFMFALRGYFSQDPFSQPEKYKRYTVVSLWGL